jgi:hypothetical protein
VAAQQPGREPSRPRGEPAGRAGAGLALEQRVGVGDGGIPDGDPWHRG